MQRQRNNYTHKERNKDKMEYKGITILAEACTEHGVYTLDKEGNLSEFKHYIDTEPEIAFVGIDDEETGFCEWFDTLDELKKFIDEEVRK